MKIALGCDEAGFELKQIILDKLKEQAYELNRQPNRFEKIHYDMEILEVVE